LTFNYDRVVDVLRKKDALAVQFSVNALHGTVPAAAELLELIKNNKPVTQIATPGPSKQTVSSSQVWDAAAGALQNAQRLIVIGYSFPPSDAIARNFVLRHFKGRQVGVVLGDGTAGDAVCQIFNYIGGSGVENTKHLSQTYLTEGTAGAASGFLHEIYWQSSGSVMGSGALWGR